MSIIKRIIQFLVFTSAGILILYYLWQSQADAYTEECIIKGIAVEDCSLIQKWINDFKDINIFWLSLVVVCFIASSMVRAIRWQMFIKTLGHQLRFGNSFCAIMISLFANLFIPRVGELVRTGIISKYEKIPYEQVFGTVILDRILDIISMIIFLILGFCLYFAKLNTYILEHVSITSSSLVYVMVCIAFFAIIVFGLLYFVIKKPTSSLSPILQTLKNKLIGFSKGLISIKKISNLPLFLFYSIVIWIMYLFMYYFALLSYDPTSHLVLSEALFVFDFAALGILFPSPGGMGSFHAMVVEALKILDVNPLHGFSFAMIIFFMVFVLFDFIFGIISLILLPIINRKKKN